MYGPGVDKYRKDLWDELAGGPYRGILVVILISLDSLVKDKDKFDLALQ